MESEFELVVHDSPNHDEEAIAAIRNSCVKWVHDTHTVAGVTRLIYANLDAGKSTHVICIVCKNGSVTQLAKMMLMNCKKLSS